MYMSYIYLEDRVCIENRVQMPGIDFMPWLSSNGFELYSRNCSLGGSKICLLVFQVQMYATSPSCFTHMTVVSD